MRSKILNLFQRIKIRFLIFVPLLACGDKITQALSGNVTPVAPDDVITGDLSEGGILSDLDWAQNSSVACWPGNEHINFMGNHVFYSVDQDPHTLVTATVTPASADVDVNVYILQQTEGNSQVPPNVTAWCGGVPAVNRLNPGRRFCELTAINKSYYNVIGVAGPEGVVSGGFTDHHNRRLLIGRTYNLVPFLRGCLSEWHLLRQESAEEVKQTQTKPSVTLQLAFGCVKLLARVWLTNLMAITMSHSRPRRLCRSIAITSHLTSTDGQPTTYKDKVESYRLLPIV